MKKIIFVSLSFGFLVMTVFAAQFWEKKDYTAWTRDECKEILSKSPWAYEYTDTTFYDPAANPLASGTATDQSNSTQLEPQSGERESTLIFNLTLMTAKPVRMALGQLQLLQKPELKPQVENYVNQPESKIIVVQLRYSSKPAGMSALHDIQSFFQSATLSTFVTNTYLIGAETKKSVYPTEYAKPDQKNPFPSFVFPRFNEKGEPLFTATEKTISLRTEFTVLIKVKGKEQKFSLFAKMDTKKMTFRNELAM
jgi:hypothetical protein